MLLLFNFAWTTLMPSLCVMLVYSARTPIVTKVLFSRILPRICTFLIKSAESLKWHFSSLTGGWSTSWDMLAVMQNLSLVILGFMACVFLETYKTPEFFLLELPAFLLLVRLVILQILVIWLHRRLFFCTTWLVHLEFLCKSLYGKLSVRLTMQSSTSIITAPPLSELVIIMSCLMRWSFKDSISFLVRLLLGNFFLGCSSFWNSFLNALINISTVWFVSFNVHYVRWAFNIKVSVILIR